MFTYLLNVYCSAVAEGLFGRSGSERLGGAIHPSSLSPCPKWTVCDSPTSTINHQLALTYREPVWPAGKPLAW